MKARLSAKFCIMKISFDSYGNKSNSYVKGFALNIAYIIRFTTIRKRPIRFL